MSKQITVLLPHVPEEFGQALNISKPPYLLNMVGEKLGHGTFNLELTFSLPPTIQTPEEEKSFRTTAKGSLILALIMFYESCPDLLARTLIYLISSDPEWKKRAEEVKKTHGPKGPSRLASWFIHDLIVVGGDLIGVDHRPCWDAGRCLHEEGDK